MNPQNSARLIKELKGSKFLPPFNELQAHLLTLQSMLYRNKRNMLVYIDHRLNKIEEAFWEFGSVLPKDYLNYISEEEQQYLQQYNKMISDYEDSLPLDLQLTKDIQVPSNMNIEVRVLKDVGDIITKNGDTLRLKKDTFHYVLRTDVEHLILQGYLQPTGN